MKKKNRMTRKVLAFRILDPKDFRAYAKPLAARIMLGRNERGAGGTHFQLRRVWGEVSLGWYQWDPSVGAYSRPMSF